MVATVRNPNEQIFRRMAPLVMVALLTACSSKNPERPDHVPASAEWAGGSDGGAWIACSKKTLSQYACTVYDHDGKLWASGTYTIKKITAVRSYEGYDGARILLQDGGYLEQEHP